jgi:hypothetical protein
VPHMCIKNIHKCLKIAIILVKSVNPLYILFCYSSLRKNAKTNLPTISARLVS